MPHAVILTSHSDDYQAVLSYLTDIKEETYKGTIYETGRFFDNNQEWEVAIAEIDSGNTSAASETEKANSHFQPDVLFLVGVADGIKDVAIGDVVIATKIYGYESGKADGQGFRTRPEVGKTDYSLTQRAKSVARKGEWAQRLPEIPSMPAKVFIAPVSSGEKVIDSKESDLFEFLRDCYNDAIAVENSAFGCINSVERNQPLSALTFHGISRLVGENNTGDSQTNFRGIAVQNASAFAFEVLSKIKVNETKSDRRIDGLVYSSVDSGDLATEISQQVGITLSDSNLGNVQDERHKRLNHAHELIRNGNLTSAIQYLASLKEDLWFGADNLLRYRLLTNLGIAKSGVGKISEASIHYIEALQYKPDDDMALAHAARGYEFQEDYAAAEKYALQALEKNPSNTVAHGLLIKIAPISESMESLAEKVPVAYRNSTDVLIALGVAAIYRNSFDEAEKWWETALLQSSGSSMDTVKVYLAAILIDPIARKDPLIIAGQLSESSKIRLERSITLLTEALGGDHVDPKNLSHLTEKALRNRAIALRLLGKREESIRDVEVAIRKEPNDHSLIKLRAILAHEIGKHEEAYTHVKEILFSPQTPEVTLLAANMLVILNRVAEAESLLNQFLESDVSDGLKQAARQLKFSLAIRSRNKDNAEKILSEIETQSPESTFFLIRAIIWHDTFTDKKEVILQLIEKAKAAVCGRPSLLDEMELANLLYSLSYYRDASEVYEQFVDKDIDSYLSQNLLKSYYQSGDYKKALELSKTLLDRNGPSKLVSEMAVFIYSNIVGDAEAAQQICNDYLSINPNDPVLKIRLASIHYATGNYTKLDEILASSWNADDLDFYPLKELARLYKFRGEIDRFLEVVYKIRHRFYDNGEAHAFYQYSYIRVTKLQDNNCHDLDQVKDECGVLLRSETGDETWYILDNQIGAIRSRDELDSTQPLYNTLLGKSHGEEIVLVEDNLGKRSLTVAAITDKYFAAGKQGFSIIDKRTDIKSIRMVSTLNEEGEESSDWIEKFIKQFEQWGEHSNRIKSDYIAGKLPFGSIATLQNENPLKTWQNLVFDSNPFIHTWSNFEHEKFSDAIIALQKGGLIVIDPISLMTLHHLNVADDTVNLLGQFGIALTAIDMFRSMIEELQDFESEGLDSIGVEEGKTRGYQITSEQVRQHITFLERIINWTKENCITLPCHRALDIDTETRAQLNQCMGTAFVDTALIAGEPGRILYSDDQLLRSYANSDSGVAGVWTQTLLNYCFREKSINEPLYQKASVHLAILGYSHTVIEPNTLITAAQLTQWKPDLLYTSLLEKLDKRGDDLVFLVRFSMDFLYQLYLEPIVVESQLIDPRDALVCELLRVFTKRFSNHQFTTILKLALQKKFKFIPIQSQRVSNVIDIWLSQQLILT